MYTQVLVMKTQILPLENHDVDQQGSGPGVSGVLRSSYVRAAIWATTPYGASMSPHTNANGPFHSGKLLGAPTAGVDGIHASKSYHTRAATTKLIWPRQQRVLVSLAIAVIHTIQDPSTVKVRYTKPGPARSNPTTTQRHA